jgi:hypothetical protein
VIPSDTSKPLVASFNRPVSQEATAQRVLELYDERIAEFAIDADALTDQDVLIYDSGSRDVLIYDSGSRTLHTVSNRLEAAMGARTNRRSRYKHKRKMRRAVCYKQESEKQRAECLTTTQAPRIDM